MKISQVKANLQTIIINLSQLQTSRDNLTQDTLITESEKITKCKMNIENAFTALESEQLAKVVSTLKQRKAERIRRTKKIKSVKAAAKSSKNSTQLNTSYCTELSEQRPMNSLLKRKAKDAKKYLSIMDSLEDLHKLRNGGDGCNLSESLSSIRSILKTTAETTRKELQKPPSIEAQWRQVLFGDTSKTAENGGLKDFIQKRCMWDSYIVSDDDPSGSCIPIGWVCPREDARPEWMQYRV